VHTAAAELGIGQIPEDNDFRFVDWYPGPDRYPCCGYHCQTCPGGLGEDADPYYCANNSPVRAPPCKPCCEYAHRWHSLPLSSSESAVRCACLACGCDVACFVACHAPASAHHSCAVVQKGTSMWFYTWQDCDMINATRTNPEIYCGRESISCDMYMPSEGLGDRLKEMGRKYREFSRSSRRWQKEYARGHCKLNALGARYSDMTQGKGVRGARHDVCCSALPG
jgi:hypothetical protein